MPDSGARTVVDVQRGLRALRLNVHFPPWRSISDHLDGVRLLPPGAALRLDAASGWPHPEEWLRVRVDRHLAPELLGRLQAIEAAGDLSVSAKAAYLRALLAVTPLGTPALSVSLIESAEGFARYEVVLDRLELGRPSLVRWTLRLREVGQGRFSPDALEARATEHFEQRLRRLTAQTPLAAYLLLREEPSLSIEELVRGELGPILHRPEGSGPWVSAVLSRLSPLLSQSTVEDPLLEADFAVPGPGLGVGLAHHRKWAVPAADMASVRAWLAARGARNIVYTY